MLTRDFIAARRPENLALHCASDFPAGEFDVVVLPCSAAGEAELVRDNIQAALERLVVGGHLIVSTDNRKDHWLGEVLHNVLKHVDVIRSKKGTIYVGHKKEPLKKIKSYVCEVVFRDGEALAEVRKSTRRVRASPRGCGLSPVAERDDDQAEYQSSGSRLRVGQRRDRGRRARTIGPSASRRLALPRGRMRAAPPS
ncbi:MAG: hypothetical protein QM811_17285 [Pirellulales bacterium]